MYVGCINVERWIGEDLEDRILTHVKKFEGMKLKIMK